MKIEKIGSAIPNIAAYNRTKLVDKLPLSTPYSVEIFPVNACNLRCIFCGRASNSNEYHDVLKCTRMMNIKLFKKSVNDMKKFPQLIKTLHFTGFGEPLLHKNIAEMVRYSIDSQVADKVDITTNGIMLSNKLADKLINADPFLIKISINGLSSEEYKKNCGVEVDFDKLVDNISYFYINKKNTKVYIKTLDYIVPTEEQKKKFYEIFEPICDSLSVEHLSELGKGINYNKIAKVNQNISVRGFSIRKYNVCPMPFYYLRINPDGYITPCCEASFSQYIGNIKEKSLFQIWNGKKFNELRVKMLDGAKNVSYACKTCKIYEYGMYPEDVLDDYSSKLKSIYHI